MVGAGTDHSQVEEVSNWCRCLPSLSSPLGVSQSYLVSLAVSDITVSSVLPALQSSDDHTMGSMSTIVRTTIILVSLATIALARLDTLTTTDYLSISVDCKDSRIKVERTQK